ncbi:MAG: AAC(3) family N-acetyltransferase [Gemmatimonadota bacterium]|nr:AAC(3) family N-acetyltransferase [Gemmatimonadota bacterium]
MTGVAGVTEFAIRNALQSVGLSGRPLCVHSSLRSFGNVEGGAPTAVQSLLAEGCTILVPTFSSTAYEVWPDPPDTIERNGVPRNSQRRVPARAGGAFSPDVNDSDGEMGAIPAAVLAMPERVRGNHPLDSFSAVGPLAHELVDAQSWSSVFAPLEALIAAEGAVVLMGVGLDRLTLLHLAEYRAGRSPFVRWATRADGSIMRVRLGGCSDGFPRLAPALAAVTEQKRVGDSRWSVLPAAEAVEIATEAIRANPEITHCANPACDRCNDAVLGGPQSLRMVDSFDRLP